MRILKIGIITLSASDNCGSLLQCYALKNLLEKYGDVEVINFSSEASQKVYNLFPDGFFKKSSLKKVSNTRFLSLLNEKHAYKTFRKTFLKIKGKELFPEDLFFVKNKYDIVVTGSDQVWNVMMGDFNDSFFLHWTDAKKVAFAPSMGGHDFRESKSCNDYLKYIKQFSSISVRDDMSLQCLIDLGIDKVEKVLDPTLTIEDSEFKKLIGKPIIKGQYFFFYSWAYNLDSLIQIVSNEGKKANVPVLVIDARKWMQKNPKDYGFTLCQKQGPIAFLNLMYYAERCYLESFHGVVFAYLFNKNFWLLDWHSDYDAVDSRLKDLVELLNLKDRIIFSSCSDEIDHSRPINYQQNLLLEELRNQTLMFIEKAFSK